MGILIALGTIILVLSLPRHIGNAIRQWQAYYPIFFVSLILLIVLSYTGPFQSLAGHAATGLVILHFYLVLMSEPSSN